MSTAPLPGERAAERAGAHRAPIAPFRLRAWAMARVGVRMMFHDKFKLTGTVAGVVFATILAVQQLSILVGLLAKNTMLVDQSNADIWITPPGTTLLQPGQLLPDTLVNRARTTEGVDFAEPLLYSGGTLHKPGGGSEPVSIVGTSLPEYLGGPWNLVAGTREVLDQPDTMIFEDSEREKYGGLNLGSVREVNGHQVRVGGFTWGLLPFGPAYSFAEIGLARTLTSTPTNRESFVLVRVRPGANVDAVARRLAARLPDEKVMTAAVYSRTIELSLLREQLGLSFGVSTAFGLIIGFVIVALSMFSSVLDNLREFGTLKAIGCTNADLTVLLLVQSACYAAIGSYVGLGLVTRIADKIRSPKLVPIVPHPILYGVPPVMLALCVVASLLALVRVRKLEPGMVFR